MEIENQKTKSNGLKKLIFSQFIILLLGTSFAWVNFIREFIAWQNNKPCKTGCNFNVDNVYSLTQTPSLPNPFLTPCFYGAIFFTIALILSVIIVRNFNKTNSIAN